MKRGGVPWALVAGVWSLTLTAWMVLHQPAQAYIEGRVVDSEGEPAWYTDIVCRGLAGEAAGQTWFAQTHRDGLFELAVSPGTLELEGADSKRQSAPRAFRVVEGQRLAVAIHLPAWGGTTPLLEIVKPEHVFAASEPPTVTVRSTASGQTIGLKVDRVDIDGVLAADESDMWLHTLRWGDSRSALSSLGPYLKRVREGSVPVGQRNKQHLFSRKVELPVTGPGCYLATVSVGGAAERFAFEVTDLAVVAKYDDEGLLVFVCDLVSGAPRANAKVKVWRANGEGLLAEASTNAEGVVRVARTVERGRTFVVQAVSGASQAVVAAGSSGYEGGYGGGYEDRIVHVHTDRPIYRPGQHVYLKGIVRDRTADGFEVPARAPVKLSIRDGRYDTVLELRTTTNDMGSFAADFDIPEEAFTGTFMVETKVDSDESETSFEVKAYVKPEYSATATGPAEPVAMDQPAAVKVQADYFFGAPVSGGTVRYSVRRHASWWSSTGGTENDIEPWLASLYRDEDGEGESYGEEVLTGETRLDDAGRATIALTPAELVPVGAAGVGLGDDGQVVLPSETHAWGLDLEAVVLDGSGREERAFCTTIVLPADLDVLSRVADGWVRWDRDAVYQLDVHDLDGRPVAGQAFRIETYNERWVKDCRTDKGWVRTAVPSPSYPGCLDPHCKFAHSYRRVVRAGPVLSATTHAPGTAKIATRFPFPGEWSFVAQTIDAHGRPVVRVDRVYVTDRHDALPDWRYEADLQMMADKPLYRIGDTATVRVQSKQETGHVLLTHEGLRLGEAHVAALKGHAAHAGFAVGPTDAPNTYVAATMVRDKEMQQGSLSLDVDLHARLLDVQVTCDQAKARPGERVSFTVKTTCGGKPVDAEVSLAVVDESIFAMKPDHPERVVLDFYSRTWNRVETVFSAGKYYYTGGKESEAPVRRYFPDTALWEPMLRTGPSGQVSVGLKLPDSLTTWRATAIACTAGTEVGFGVGKVVVNKPLMVRLETPRFATQRDRFELAAMVHNESGSPRDVKVALEAPTLTVLDPTDRTLHVGSGERARVAWRVDVKTARDARVSVSARTGTLRDAVEIQLPIKPFAAAFLDRRAGKLKGGEPEQVVTLKLPPTAQLETASLHISAGPNLGGVVLKAVEGLIGYPYGCVEQTTSRFLGCLAAEKAYAKLGWRPESWGHLKEIPEDVRHGVLRLRKMQLDDGAWGWWEDDEACEAMSAYAAHGVLTAKEAGHPVDEALLTKGLDHLAELARESKPTDHEQRAWTLYVLARAGYKLEPAVLTALLDTKLPFGAEGMALVALAANGSGLPEVQARALKMLAVALPTDLERAEPGELAWAARARLATSGAGADLQAMVDALVRRFDGDGWICTRDTCAVVELLADYLAATGQTAARGTLSITVDGEAQKPFVLDDESVKGPGVSYTVAGAALRPGDNEVRLKLDGTGVLNWSLSIRASAAVDEMPPPQPSESLRVARTYELLRRGSDGKFVYLPVPDTLHLDDVLMVTLRARASRAVDYVMIEDPLPAGFEVCDRGEVKDVSGETTERDVWWSDWTARDVRDDRVAFFYTHFPVAEGVHLTYLIRAAVAGTFHALPTLVQPMYRPTDAARGGDATLVVR